MKYIIALIVGIITFYFSFSGANNLIHYVCEGIIDPSLHAVMVIVLWIICFGLVLKVSLIGSLFVMSLIARIGDD
jgi:hypothetical protein